MGEVYAVTHVTTGRAFALKKIRACAPHDAAQTRRFLLAARAATAIIPPNDIDVFDAFEDDDGTPVMIMELLEGESLHALRARPRALPLHRVPPPLLPA